MNIKAMMAILAFLVILSFSSVGIAISFKVYWLAAILFLLGFIIMGIGLRLKKRMS